MSDLTATHCGCNNNSSIFGGGSCNWIIWILILSCFCGNNGSCGISGLFGGNNGGCGCNDGCCNNSCEWLIWILILSCFCGGNNGCC